MITSTYSFIPARRVTDGAVLVGIDFQSVEVEDGVEYPIWKVSQMGNEYCTLVMDDGCRFNITRKAINYLTTDMFGDEQNPDFVPEGIVPGRRYSLQRGENGKPVVKCLS